METLRQEINKNDIPPSPSPEMFSFPGTPTDVEEFEFGSCVTPDSPTTPGHDQTKNSASPADQFFLNGRLLPHDFPVVHTSSRTSFSGRENAVSSNNSMINLSRGTSVGSNMSIMSSRSNSTNSRGSSTCSTCSSARTSSSEGSERRTSHKRMHMKGYCRTASVRERNSSNSALAQYGSSGSSKRWQFITPAPVLGPSRSRRGRREAGVGAATSPKKGNGDNSNHHGGLLHRILRTFIATCKACHAMEGQDNEFDLDPENL